jgi:aspartate carbamoyltransferase catalytic subunit
MVGDLKNGRTVHSLAKALALRNNVIIHYVSPSDLAIPTEVWDYVAKRGLEQHIHTDGSGLTDDLIAKADVLYDT